MPSIEHHVAGKEYWRSLEEAAGSPAARESGQEFFGVDPNDASSPSRRNFLKIMGASVALSGLTLEGCRRWPQEKLAPYSSNPRGRMPGVPEQYATAWEIGGVATGLLVTSYDGRPIKIEGNPSHPYAQTEKDPKTGQYRLGSADAFAQASVLELYDPERSRSVIQRTEEQEAKSTWDAFASAVRMQLDTLKNGGEQTIAILSEATCSPSLLDMRQRFESAFPGAAWFEYEPISHDLLTEGTNLAFGQRYRPILHLDKASSVLLLDTDVLGTHPAHTRYAADWADRRRAAALDPRTVSMSRVFIAESTFSLTGSVADVRIGVKPDRLHALLTVVAAKLGVAGAMPESLEPELTGFANAVAADLQRAGSEGLVACGPTCSPQTHALSHAINAKLGAAGTTVTYVTDPVLNRPTHAKAMRDLCGAMFAGNVGLLVMLGGNPIFDAPMDLEFGKCLSKVPLSIHLSVYDNETSRASNWHLPRAHYLESWGDARAWDGVATIQQPLIEPLFGGKSPSELLALLMGDPVNSGDAIVRRTWMATGGLLDTAGTNSDLGYRVAMEAGVLADSTWKSATPAVTAKGFGSAEKTSEGLVIRFEEDPRVYDGRFANNGWLQETPGNIAKLVWDNAAVFSRADADSLDIKSNDMVSIELPKPPGTGDIPGGSLEIAAYVLPGQPVGVIGLTLGYGRTAAGHIGNGQGFNTYLLRKSKTPAFAGGVKVTKLDKTYKLAETQLHHQIEGVAVAAVAERVGDKRASGKIIHEGTFADFAEDPSSVHGVHWVKELELFNPPSPFNDTHRWGMSIDLSSCIGCNACAVACQAENNIPIVGKEQVFNHREMNWIRIDRYFKGEPTDPNPEVVYQPMMCQQCENAPCEQVCPVAATMHDSEGLNTMVYNRCIGTRYCSNNCPYKVRRFNYLDYHSKDPMQTIPLPYPNIPDMQQMETVDPIKRMVFNPEVTIRMRGVMEKCTYCVQRIHRATIADRGQGKDVVDGEIVTACEQACPTQAIRFGDLNDPDSRVTKLHRDARSYPVLNQELNTRPRSRYLAKLTNPAENEPEAG